MLVLGRKLNESILIGSDVRVILVGGVHPRQTVRIGIEAPKTVPVVRGELPILPPEEPHLPLEDPEVPPR